MNALGVPLVQKFFAVVVNPAIRLLFAAAVVYFVYGVFNYVRHSSDGDARAEGANHILWSTIGLFIMVSVWGIIGVLRSTVGQ